MSEFDVFLSHNSRDKRVVQKLKEELSNRGLRVWVDVDEIPPGSLWIPMLEKIVSTCRAAAVCVGDSGVGPWEEPEMYALLNRQINERKLGRHFPVIPVLLPGASSCTSPSPVPTFHALYSWLDLRNGFTDEALDRFLWGITGEKVGSTVAASARERPGRRCPFPGPNPFSEQDRGIFFGRDREVEDVLQKLGLCRGSAGRRWLFVTGGSGIGKTSFVTAGVAPAMRMKQANSSNADVRDDVAWRVLRPMKIVNDPYGQLVDVLVENFKPERKDVREQLACDNQSRKLHNFLREHSAGERILLIVDQLEDASRLRQFDDSIEMFDRLVSEALSVVGGPLHLVTVVRSEYFNRCLDRLPRLRELAEGGMSMTYTLPPVSRDGIFAIVQRSFDAVGLQYDAALAEHITDDAIDSGASALALVQDFFHVLWKRVYGSSPASSLSVLTREVYDSIGGIGGTLRDQAEFVFRHMNEHEQENAKRVLGALVKPTLNLREERQSVFREIAIEMAGGGQSGEAVVEFMSGLRHALPSSQEYEALPRLINVNNVGQIDGASECCVELAHKSLLDWQVLRFIKADLQSDQLAYEDLRNRMQQERSDYVSLDDPKWTHERRIAAYRSIERLKRLSELDDATREFLGPVMADEVYAEIKDDSTTAPRRLALGERLSAILDIDSVIENGMTPEIKWCPIEAGKEVIAGERSFGPSLLRSWRPRWDLSKTLERFSISKYLITCREFQLFLDAKDGYANDEWWKSLPKTGRYLDCPTAQWKSSLNPVNNVSWSAAMAFCLWLSARINARVTLPNEWQWQLAARGIARASSGSESCWLSKCEDAVIVSHAPPCNSRDAGLNRTTAVGMYPQSDSSAGVSDMQGNLWEWCRNKFDRPNDESYSRDDMLTRTARGGSWGTPRCECGSRHPFQPHIFQSSIGFRVVTEDRAVWEKAAKELK